MTEGQKLDSDFDWLANVYNTQGAINHPSELHGLLFGGLASGMRLNSADWLDIVVEHMGVDALDTSRQTRLEEDLISFYQSVDQAVENDSNSFALFLPDDDYEISQRVEALTLWVRGFLEGLALSANASLSALDEDLQEILRDFVDISQLDLRVSASEAAEKEFFEICEYVRVGVLNIYAEFNTPEAPAGDADTPEFSAKRTLH